MIKNYLKKIYSLKAFSYFINILSYPWKGKGAILLYHRVLPDELVKNDLEVGMAVSKSNFEKQIKKIKSKYDIVSMDEFISNLENKVNKFTVTLTFDDGYLDNLDHVLPILEKYQVPASIYVTTSFLENEVFMWWYELKKATEDKTSLNFEFDNNKYQFNLNTKIEKLQAYESLRNLFLNLKTEKQHDLIQKITGDIKRKNYSDICLKPDELKILDKNPLVTIGSHAHNHLNLKILNNEEINYEIKKSEEILEKLLNHKVKHFAYPFGGIKQASDREYKLIEKSNFTSAVTGRVYPIKNSDFYSLPRIYVGTNINEHGLMNHINGFYSLINKF